MGKGKIQGNKGKQIWVSHNGSRQFSDWHGLSVWGKMVDIVGMLYVVCFTRESRVLCFYLLNFKPMYILSFAVECWERGCSVGGEDGLNSRNHPHLLHMDALHLSISDSATQRFRDIREMSRKRWVADSLIRMVASLQDWDCDYLEYSNAVLFVLYSVTLYIAPKFWSYVTKNTTGHI